jgi:hypothetical protein
MVNHAIPNETTTKNRPHGAAATAAAFSVAANDASRGSWIRANSTAYAA